MSKWTIRINETIDWAYSVEATSEEDAFEQFSRLTPAQMQKAFLWKESVGFEAPWTAEEDSE